MACLLRPLNRDGFEIAILCALPVERDAVEALLDEEYEKDGFSYGKAVGDLNTYTTGRLGNQHVVLANMPSMGMISATAVAVSLRSSFERLKIGIVVGICGGVPTTADGVEIVLGDVIISTSVIQIDFGRQYPNAFFRKASMDDTLGRANPEIRSFIGKISGRLVSERLQEKVSVYSAQICARKMFSKSAYPGPEKDQLYPAKYQHKHWRQGSCSLCDNWHHLGDDVCEEALKKSCVELGCDKTRLIDRKRLQKALGIGSDGSQILTAEIKEAQKACIHFGRLACSSQVIKSGLHRDHIAHLEGVIGFEMEGAGTWDYIPTIVIKSVCDYADSHKNKDWQEYAAATAAACTKAFLEEWRSIDRPGQDALEFSPSTSPFIPFRRDPDFIHCGALPDQIHQRCLVPGSRTALVGLGGVGKSQLAIEYDLLTARHNGVLLGLQNNLDRTETSLNSAESNIVSQIETDGRALRGLLTDAELRLQESQRSSMADVFTYLKDLKAHSQQSRYSRPQRKRKRRCPRQAIVKSTTKTGLPIEDQVGTQLYHLARGVARYIWERMSSGQNRLLVRKAWAGIVAPLPQCSQAPTGLDEEASLLSKNLLLAVIFGIVSFVAADDYQRKKLQKFVSRFADDPAFGLFALLSCYFLMHFLSSLPRQLSLLSDTSILFQDPFGTEIKIPFLQCEHPVIFQAYLHHYFRELPGLTFIKRKRYVLLAGGQNGQLVREEAWAKYVLPNAVLLMSMIIRSEAIKCPCCEVYLTVTPGSSCICPDCGRHISSISSEAIDEDTRSRADTKHQSNSLDDQSIKLNRESFIQSLKPSFIAYDKQLRKRPHIKESAREVIAPQRPQPHRWNDNHIDSLEAMSCADELDFIRKSREADKSEMIELADNSSEDPKSIADFKYLHILLLKQPPTAETANAEGNVEVLQEEWLKDRHTISLERYLANNVRSLANVRQWTIIACHLVHDLARIHAEGKSIKTGFNASFVTINPATWEAHFQPRPPPTFVRSFGLRYERASDRADIAKLGDIMKRLALGSETHFATGFGVHPEPGVLGLLPQWYSSLAEMCIDFGRGCPNAEELVRMTPDDEVPPNQRWWLTAGLEASVVDELQD